MRRVSFSFLIFDGFVVVTVIAVVGAIAALLPYAEVHRKLTYGFCAFVAVFGIVAVRHQIKRLYRIDKTRRLITELLAEGEQLALRIVTTSDDARKHPKDFPNKTVPSHDNYLLMLNWCGRVETVLRTWDESYVTRFHLGGSIDQDQRSMTIWKTRHRLETLASFLLEIK